MIENPLDMLRDGVVGTFQPLAEPGLKKWFDGHIKIADDRATIAVIARKKRDPAAEWANDMANSRIVAGITEAGTVLAPVEAIHRSTTRGDFSMPVVRWHLGNLLVNVDFDEVDDDTISASQMHYVGLGSWSGRPDHVDEPITERDGYGWRIEVHQGQERTAEIDPAFDLTIEHDWTLTGPEDQRSLQRPLKVGVRSSERRPLREHVERLDAVHALLSIAHWKPVSAIRGVAQLAPGSKKRALLWDHTMVAEVVRPDNNEFPVFTLADIGDLTGLAAWVNVCLTKPRAVTPIVRHRLFQNQTPEARLLYTAAALEYWTASNARNPDAPWAKKVPERKVPEAIGNSVGQAWEAWIGDPDRWSKQFYGTYVHLKHTANLVDPDVVDALEYSGRWLLAASILDQCADSTASSDRIFSGRGLRYPVPGQVRGVLDEAPVPRDDRR
ncbi:hypothetical protein GCM10009641_88400 [Mycobacterium cookii]|uniref:ApeA N-terminal domain-containing protein n=1 Tax=Nocardioides furvisabuli TaxID=375542 RepID=A0ABN2WJY5_9ACTN|nr:hypothetical protein [Nocardioides furvisabuli]